MARPVFDVMLQYRWHTVRLTRRAAFAVGLRLGFRGFVPGNDR